MKMIINRLKKQKFVSTLKILSLGVGIACTLILFYVGLSKLKSDEFYSDSDRMYQVFMGIKTANVDGVYPSGFQPLGPALMTDIPQIEYGTVVNFSGRNHYYFNNIIVEANTMYADSMFFNVFERAFLVGNSKESLLLVNKAVITKAFALKVFGEVNVVGKKLDLKGSREVEVSGVIENWPSNSSFDAEVILSFATLRDEDRLYMGWLGGDSFHAFIKLMQGANINDVETQFPDFQEMYMNMDRLRERNVDITFKAISLAKAPFLKNKQLKSTIIILFLLAALLFGLVCFNTILLSIAQQQKMLKEFFVRRLQGSSNFGLQKLLFYDVFFQYFLSIIVAFSTLKIISPIVLQSFNIDILSSILTPMFIGVLSTILIVLFVVVFGIPSLVMRRKLIRMQNSTIASKQSGYADLPLAFQIGLSFTLFVFFFFILKQLNYIQNFDKGYDSSQLAYVELNNEQLFGKDELIKSELLKLPGIQGACLSDDIPLYGLSGNNFGLKPDGIDYKNFRYLNADADFFTTFGVNVNGKGFSQNYVDSNSVLISESVALELGLDDPLYKHIYGNGGEAFTIVGIVPDIVAGTIHNEKSHIVFNRYSEPSVYSILTLRLNDKLLTETRREIVSTIQRIASDRPVDLKFYDQQVLRNYEFDYAIKKTVTFFSIIAIILTIAGLVGFFLSEIVKRVKEIGIRKVNGASEWSLLLLINKGFIIKTAFALIVFSPIAYWLCKLWLGSYAYHVPLNPMVWIVLSLSIEIVVFVSISVVIGRAIKKNPIEALRYE